MASINDRYPASGFLKAADLRDRDDLIVQIDRVDLDVEINGKLRDIVRFRNDGRSLALNQPVGQMIAKLCGDDTDDWPGKWIALFCDESIEYMGHVGGVRVRPTIPAAGNGPTQSMAPPREAPKPRRQDLDDEIPF